MKPDSVPPLHREDLLTSNVAKATLQALLTVRPKAPKAKFRLVKISDFMAEQRDPLQLN